MLILAVDTAGSTGGLLLARCETTSPDSSGSEVLGGSVLEPREFSTQLVSGVAKLLKSSGVALAELDAFAVVSGPGSFTGLRIGLSAVKAMAEATRKPVIALSRLAVMASMADTHSGGEAGVHSLPVHAVLDAGRGEFYHGIYRDAGWTCIAERLETLPSLESRLQETPGLLAGCEPAVFDSLMDLNIHPISFPSVADAWPLAWAAWRAHRFSDVARLDANYLRSIEPGRGSRLAVAPGQPDAPPADAQQSRS